MFSASNICFSNIWAAPCRLYESSTPHTEEVLVKTKNVLYFRICSTQSYSTCTIIVPEDE